MQKKSVNFYDFNFLKIFNFFIILSFVFTFGFLHQVSATNWTIQTADSNSGTGYYPSITLDGSGNPTISYYDNTNTKIKLAQYNGSAWSTQDVATGFYYSTVTYNGSNPVVAYWDSTNHDVRRAEYSGTWSDSVVMNLASDETVGSIHFDNSGNIGATYEYPINEGYGNATAYGYYNGSSWTSSGVDYDSNEFPIAGIIAYDSSNNPGIAYEYYDVSYNGSLKYRKYNGSSWDTIQTVDSSGSSPSLVFISDNPAMSYFDTVTNDLKYAKYNGSSWDIVTVDSSAKVESYVSMAVYNGNPAIAYTDSTTANTNLKFAQYNGSTWDIETVDTDYGGQYGVSLTFDSSGNPLIAYTGSSSANLYYASPGANTPTGNTSTVFDTSGSFLGNDSATYFAGLGQYEGLGSVAVTFDNVTAEGDTTASFGEAYVDPTTAANLAALDWNFIPFDGTNQGLFYGFSTAATFDAGLKLTFKIDPARIPFGFGTDDLYIVWDKGAGNYEMIKGTYVPATQTVWAYFSGGTFSGYGVAVQPEPATLFLLGSGLFGLFSFRKKFFNKK